MGSGKQTLEPIKGKIQDHHHQLSLTKTDWDQTEASSWSRGVTKTTSNAKEPRQRISKRSKRLSEKHRKTQWPKKEEIATKQTAGSSPPSTNTGKQ